MKCAIVKQNGRTVDTIAGAQNLVHAVALANSYGYSAKDGYEIRFGLSWK